jgi:hypothetical protein
LLFPLELLLLLRLLPWLEFVATIATPPLLPKGRRLLLGRASKKM